MTQGISTEPTSSPHTSGSSAVTHKPGDLRLPRIFEYVDYRIFLRDWFQFKKMTTASYSGAVFARRARIQSHTLFGLVARGQRNLTAQSIRAFSRGLELSGREAIYFEKVVLFNQSTDSEDKAYYFEQLHSLSQGSGKRTLEAIRDYATYLKHWYVPAIRELVRLPEFRVDFEWMAEALKRKISHSEAQEAWTALVQLGFVVPAAQPGRFAQAHPHIDIAPGQVDFVIRNFHREQLARSSEAIDGEPLSERQFSSLTLSLSANDYERFQSRLEEFRKNLNLEFPATNGQVGPVDRIIAWNSQTIQLTQTIPQPSPSKSKGDTQK